MRTSKANPRPSTRSDVLRIEKHEHLYYGAGRKRYGNGSEGYRI
jgi:hypothetical protein